MNLILNFPKDKNALEDGVANFKAILINRSIDNLKINDNEKHKIKENIIKKLINLE